MKVNATRFNEKTKQDEIGYLRRGKFTVVESAPIGTVDLARKYGKRVVFYDGKYAHLQ